MVAEVGEAREVADDVGIEVDADGAGEAVLGGELGGAVAREVEPGVTLSDELNSVAGHNAYHLGKIVALRQRIGAWPPPGASAES